MSEEELSLTNLFEKIRAKHSLQNVTIETTLRVLLRCRMMFDCRGQIIRILQIIDVREEKLRDLNLFVIKGASNN